MTSFCSSSGLLGNLGELIDWITGLKLINYLT
jgi:hypothetical protein